MNIEAKEIMTLSDIIDDNKSLSISSIFLNSNCSNLLIEIFSKNKQRLNIVFRKYDYVNSENEINLEKLNELSKISF